MYISVYLLVSRPRMHDGFRIPVALVAELLSG